MCAWVCCLSVFVTWLIFRRSAPQSGMALWSHVRVVIVVVVIMVMDPRWAGPLIHLAQTPTPPVWTLTWTDHVTRSAFVLSQHTLDVFVKIPALLFLVTWLALLLSIAFCCCLDGFGVVSWPVVPELSLSCCHCAGSLLCACFQQRTQRELGFVWKNFIWVSKSKALLGHVTYLRRNLLVVRPPSFLFFEGNDDNWNVLRDRSLTIRVTRILEHQIILVTVFTPCLGMVCDHAQNCPRL